MTPAAFAQVDLRALLHNLQLVRAQAPQAKVMAVIKANAYGHGLLRIAAVLHPHVEAIAVARTDEGIRLRKAGFEKPITVLEGFVAAEELAALAEFRLDTVVHTADQIRQLQQPCAHDKVNVWIKMDTGMHRLGLQPGEFSHAYQALVQAPAVQQILGLMTHLSNADDVNDTATRQQLALFATHSRDIPGERSIANSAAILGWPESLSEWVRPGLMLFGCSPFGDKEGLELGLRPVMSLHSRVIAVKNILAGEAVGYGGSWVSPKNTRLGVIAVGYGDGYPRHIRPGSPVLVNQQPAPIVGRVSMDMITVDLNAQPEAKSGDPAVLWGPGLPIEKVAQAADTIPYTLLCGITQRVHIVES